MHKKYTPHNVLIINPFGIGDVLFSTPLIHNVKYNFPQATIGFLCNKRTQAIVKNNPYIDYVFVYERDDLEALKKQSSLLWIKGHLSLLNAIRKKRFDVALDLSLNSKFGFFAWFAGIKRRVGLDYKKRGRFLTDKIRIEGYEGRHVVEYYLDVLKLLQVPVRKFSLELYVDRESKKWADAFLKENDIAKEELVIGIAPCGGESFGALGCIKHWPKERFSLLIKKIKDECNAKIFIFAGPKEHGIVKDITAQLDSQEHCYVFTNLPLEKAVALMDRCALLVSNDSGLLKCADALHKKVVALFGAPDEKVYGPYAGNGNQAVVMKKDLPCRPCYKKFKMPECPYDIRCLKSIEVAEVFSAVKQLLNDTVEC